ncbi:transporter substrate-binding domain-containing protein [Lutibacter sp. A80]|uniref:response regulator n=1 Tax=Lutibacter sp. A80 TaxID=2918453 RepID=UPI001F05B33E|nr:transporter substrate-binding domain-containing protein [Lutibacter sp. A80]UMB61291.1 transporter substrate-binding domain-containing protein [Lutibacter sp. A80]
MKQKIILLLLFVTLSICKLNAQYEVMFSNNYPPYNYLNENGELVGFNVEILKAIKDLYKTDIKISGGEWNTIIKALKTNEIDAIGGFHFPGNPDPDYIYTRAAINTSHCFLYNSKHYNNFSIEFLRTSKEPLVAMWKNDVLVHYIQSINPSTKFLFIKSYEDLILALDKSNVTCSFGQRTGAMYYAKILNRTDVKSLDHRILERSMGFRVSKEAPELAKILNNGLEVILANGKYQEIYDTWISEYDKNNNQWRNYLKYLFIASIIVLLLFILLIIINWILQAKIKNKTKDLREQLELNSKIMIELKKEKDKAEESDKMKSAFLANMSHEIRTPMNGILGFTSLLKTVDYSSEKQAQFIDIIQKSGHRMLDTINNIIEVSKLESGLEKPIIKEVDIEKNINELNNFFSTEASEKGINLIFKHSKSTPTIPFYTDQYKVNSILTNLIKNALKFTNKGFVEVKYELTNTAVEFWIKDTGIGIPLEKQHFIFNEFVQADYSHSSGYEGSGLGLSISKGYVHLLNGEIKLTSVPNEGTTFYVRIPNSTGEVKTTSPKKKVIKNTNTQLKNYKILIAEDDETSFFYIESVLENLTKKIIRAKNGVEAVELVKNNNDIDIILMDIKMPILNGFEATKKIREFNNSVYIIAQTAYIQESFKLQAQEAGCNTYISKPIDKYKLIKLLANIKQL